MKYTLLEIVQDILNDMDADFVNSINETVESQQVAQIVKSCFNEMISNRNWPSMKKTVQLEASGSTAKPNYMQLPSGTKELEQVQYDKRKSTQTQVLYSEVKYKDPFEFLNLVQNRNSNNTNVQQVIDTSGAKLLILNDKAPEYFTSFDDSWLVFDSYDSDVETTLQKSKSLAIAFIEPSWSMTDSFIPDLPEEAFAALVEESKSTAFLVLKQAPNQKAEQKASRQQRWLSRKAWRAHGGLSYPSYGRR